MEPSRIVARLDRLSLYLLSSSPHHKLVHKSGRLIYRGVVPLIIDLNNESPLGAVNVSSPEYLTAPPPRDPPALRDQTYITGSTTGGNVTSVTGSIDAR